MNSPNDLLKYADLKVTTQRKEVLEILTRLQKPLDVDELKSLLSQKNIRVDQATIYRILKTFADKQIVQKVALQEGKTHYELADRPHHHHVVCVRCGTIQDVEECGIEEIKKIIEKKTGFSIQTHAFELFGTCSSCNNETILRTANRKSP